MKEIKLETKIRIYPLTELPEEESRLMEAAVKATGQSYAPYSKFHVGAAALLEDGTIKELGNYTVGQDLKAPTITPLGANTWISKQAFVFRLSDNLSGVQTYRGEIDGQYVLFEMNSKSVITYKFDKERLEKGKHTLKLTVTDAAGNRSEYKYSFVW